MNKSQIFKAAHSAAKATVSIIGDYAIAFSVALKEIYNPVPVQVSLTTKQGSLNDECVKILKEQVKRLNNFESSFLLSVRALNKLTVKQKDCLSKIFAKYGSKFDVNEVGSRKKSAAKKLVKCDHQDLGSFGYRHGSIVKCPHCGMKAEVW